VSGSSVVRPLKLEGLNVAATGYYLTVDNTTGEVSKSTSTADQILNVNTVEQSQITVAGTHYYIISSNINLPATLTIPMSTSTWFKWRISMTKTNAGTDAFIIGIYRGVTGTVSDTRDVTQSIGVQTADVDSMTVDVILRVITTGASGSYFWTIIPVNKAVTSTGFGVATGTDGYFSGTVS
jgi:hypothetical protein